MVGGKRFYLVDPFILFTLAAAICVELDRGEKRRLGEEFNVV